MRFRLFYVSVALLTASGAWAHERPENPAGWLKWMAHAASHQSYVGVFVRQHGGGLETASIAHFVDATGEHERIETQDGPLREVIRHDDEVSCYMPAESVLKVDKRRMKRMFPALISNPATLAEGYTVRLGKIERVADHECQVVILEPRDAHRFGHRFCADLHSGLMLQATMLGEANKPIEQFAFSQVVIGGKVGREHVKSKFADRASGWKVENAWGGDVLPVESKWAVSQLPAGFRKVAEMQRSMAGRRAPVLQQVYSDGLSSLSVFIDPSAQAGSQRAGLIQQGSYRIFVRNIPEPAATVTVVGEVPPASLNLVGLAVSSKPR